MQANDMHHCLSLLSAEQELLDQKTDFYRYFEFVDICESKLSMGYDQILLVLIQARSFLAQHLLKLGRKEEFSFQLQQIEVAMNRLPWIRQSDGPALWLLMLKVYSETSPSMKNLSARIDLASTMRKNEDTLQEREVLFDIDVILNEVDQMIRNSTWIFLNDANLNRIRELQSASGGNALSACYALSKYPRHSTANAGEYLHYLEQFESKFPAFDVPFWHLFIYQAAFEAAQKLGNNDFSSTFQANILVAWANCPAKTAFLSFHYKRKDPCEWPLDIFITLLEWMRLEFDKGSLTASDVAHLLLLEQINTSFKKIAEFFSEKIGPNHSRELTNRMYGEEVPVNTNVWNVFVERYEKWLWNSPSEVEQSIRHTILLDMHEARVSRLRNHHIKVNHDMSNFKKADLQLGILLERIAERSRMAELRQKVDSNAIGASQTNILLDEWHLMSLKATLASSVKAVRELIIKDRDLLEVQTWMEQAILKFPSSLKDHRLLTLSQIAQIMRHRYILFGTIPVDAALDVYARYDEAYVEQRRERSILRGANHLTARAQIFTRWTYTDHYLNAMALCVESLGPARLRSQAIQFLGLNQNRDLAQATISQRSNDSSMRELIEWAQKRKARSVTEVLGAEIIIPQSFLASFADDDDAVSLLRKEADLQTELDSNPFDPIKVSKQLDHVRKEMRECTSLEQIMNIRDGEAVTSFQLQAISHELGPHIIIVDYVYIPSISTGVPNEILPFVYKNGTLHSSNWITAELNNTKLKYWVQSVMNIPGTKHENGHKIEQETEPLLTEEAEEDLAMLSPLIAAAVEASEPGDTILFCPTGILFHIPLHAIPINNQPLIWRNPVVYTQSLSIIRICGLSATSLKANSPANPLAIQALPDAESSLPTAPTMAFTSKIGARLLAGSDLTKASFLEAVTQSSLIHFYGHICFDRSKPLDHYMVIRGIESERITARELFDIRLTSGAHVSLIGCKGGRSDVRVNDDQFGLSTALMYAGASSILSALWAIRKPDVHAFQESLYEEILAQCAEGWEGEGDAERMLDLAKALQKAVIRIGVDESGNRRAPYHWASFMLQGVWNALPMLSLRKK